MSAAAIDAVERRRARAARLAGLYAVTPDSNDTAELVARVVAAIAGGATTIQYRHKTADNALRRAQASALRAIPAMRDALFIVNDDVALAAEVGADGVHLGEDDPGLDHARAILGERALIGISCYNDFARAEAMAAAGADYIAFGSFFSSSVKPAARRADVELLERARALPVPVVAIGGITVENAPGLIRAGADAVAIITAVFAAGDPTDVRRAASALCTAIAAAREGAPHSRSNDGRS
jgi:thiamine-phosphate pyrophosphorylase